MAFLFLGVHGTLSITTFFLPGKSGTAVDLGNEDIPVKVLIWTGPLLATNVTATILTSYKAWCHYFILKKSFFKSRNPLTKVQKVLWLLAESGAISCILWIAYIVLGSACNESKYDPEAKLIYKAVMPVISFHAQMTALETTFPSPIQSSLPQDPQLQIESETSNLLTVEADLEIELGS
ncbi:hypothetical protein K435DRAFT_811092 [Dendrothele bispora CBS 962.96]|uniref:Uncharacterized protein n=1 Tax=Dendrothele bispora (strain CBS 962.96) TaxID=1314807 RepID=A0A4S8KT22_DENBC|nr:hypothetical protein K435DRAFT_811092 [Dendrothele bispora CBS 962.96]